MGELHARVFAEMPDTRLVAVADIDDRVAQRVADTFGVPGTTNLEEAIIRDDVHVVSICTSDQAHVEPCRIAAQAGKHILLEKPLATTVEDAEAIIAAAKEAGVLLMVGHILRFDPRYAGAKKAIADGAVGEIIHMYGRRYNVVASGQRIAGRTNVAFFLGVHDLDAMRWFADSDWATAYALGRRKVLAKHDTEDTIMALLTFENGIIATLDTCWAVPMGQARSLDARLDVVGTEGAVNIEVRGEGLRVVDQQRTTSPDVVYVPVVGDRQAGALRTQLEHFVECVRNDREPCITPQDALQAVKAAAAITESLQTGEPVTV
jgi:UDP-N-acetylglucosamine 3-dehydrogenase